MPIKSSKMKEYNGHRSWNAWNVSLWISNDYGIYMFAMECLKKKTLSKAIRVFMADFAGEKTPDGATYNRLSVKLALEGLNE